MPKKQEENRKDVDDMTCKELSDIILSRLRAESKLYWFEQNALAHMEQASEFFVNSVI